ncbi:MAG: malate synthase, partial [Actinomycetota bacterium]|nr:malate synthase [Actinomycetota bacterium]
MHIPSHVSVKGTMHPGFEKILTPEALAFVSKLDGAHAGARADLLRSRDQRAMRITLGESVDFLPETASIRSDSQWRVAPFAPGLEDRRCEITGPPTRKMSVNALNSGASVWMADFEDS